MENILNLLNDSLMAFFVCFKNGEAFRWFVCTIIGMMIRSEHLGVTSIIRALGIAPRHYEALLHFFRAHSWTLSAVKETWIKIVMRSGLLYRINGLPVIIGDGVKQSKEGRKMPCVKRLFQESENSAKPEYIFGHMFGGIGVLLGGAEHLFCTLLSMTLHDGNEVTGRWAQDPLAPESHVVRLIHEACRIAVSIAPSLLLLDRYFLTVPALLAWLESQKLYGAVVTIITKAKSNCSAYEIPTPCDPNKRKRGRPPKKGKKIKLETLFASQAKSFIETTLTMYGQKTAVSYLCKDLLWGKKLYQPLRFVLVNYNGWQSILACTNLTMPPEEIVKLYCLRFKIETCFRAFKQTLAGFAYHFWSAAMPKLNRFKKNADMQKELEKVEDEAKRAAIVSAFNAIEKFVMCACIAQGLLQMCALHMAGKGNARLFRWLRTNRGSATPSEDTIADFLRRNIFRAFHHAARFLTLHLIQSVQNTVVDSPGTYAA